MKLIHLITFLKAWWRFTTYKGKRLIPEVDRQYRLHLCSICPAHKDGRCTLCGCFTTLKSRCATETCPDDRWTVLDPDGSSK